MSAALQTIELPAEAIALIKAGNPRPMSSSTALAKPGPDERVHEAMEPPEPDEIERPRAIRSHSPREKPEPMPSQIVSMTVRVPVELPNALLRVSVDRRLQRQKPFTQQDMVATAVREWLRRNGYADLEKEP